MKQPLQITFRDMPHSDAIEAHIRKKADKLDEFYDQIMGCHVVLEQPHGHHHKGKLFHVTIDLTVPAGELVINRSPEEHHAHEDAYVAIRDAFKAMRRKLQDFARKQRGDVKKHSKPGHGKISRMEQHRGYGMIMTPEGREIYFHRNSVIDGDFDSLEIGSEVRFDEEAGDEGPQASTVYLIGKHHIVD
jgi:ribosomal subunit interface protein